MVHPIRAIEQSLMYFEAFELLMLIVCRFPRRARRRFFRQQRRFFRRIRRRRLTGLLPLLGIIIRPRRFRETSFFPNAPYFETIKIQC